MQSLPLPVVATPLTSFKQHRQDSDPSRFSLNLSLSFAPKPPGLLAASYPSPPMSGSPTPEQRHEVLRGSKSSRRSESPLSAPTVSTLAPLASSDRLSWHRASGSSPEVDRSTPRRDLYQAEFGFSRPLLSSAAGETLQRDPETTPPHESQGLPSDSSSPKTTRRSKAHVASACVNCKRKHLRCDNARPCQRCVQSKKEDSCKDVEHKKRGRPPLKPEESQTGRSYEATFAQVEMPRQAGGNTWISARRSSISRHIRPMSDLMPAVTTEPGRERALYRRPVPIVPPQLSPSGWGPATFSPTYYGGPVSPALSRPFSSDSSQRTAGSQPSSPYHTSQSLVSPLHVPRSVPPYPAYLSHAPPSSMLPPSPLHHSFPASFAPLTNQSPRMPGYPNITEPPSMSMSAYRDSRPTYQLPPIRQMPEESAPPRMSFPAPIGEVGRGQAPRHIFAEDSSRRKDPYILSREENRPVSQKSNPMQPVQPVTTAPEPAIPASRSPPAGQILPPMQLPPLTGRRTHDRPTPEPAEQSEEPRPKRLKMNLGDMVNQ